MPSKSSARKYRCKHCKRIVKRDSDKQWIKSYCEETGKNVRLWRMKDGSSL